LKTRVPPTRCDERARPARGAVDDFEAFRENGVARFAALKDAVAFANQIRDPDNHKFTTPSGEIEIYSMAMAARA
jgi:anaerobic dimethyl sulfoxide reductase subunit A